MNLEIEISKIVNRKLSKFDLTIWLENNLNNFNLINKTRQCSFRTLPCYCFERNNECLFFEIYSKLNKKARYFELNVVLEKQLIEFKKIENNETKMRNWLSNNLDLGLRDLWFFMSPNYPNIKMSFVNGKQNDEFKYLRIEIEGQEFKPIYDFANLFSKLFFEEKLLANEYAKWKYENEMPD